MATSQPSSAALIELHFLPTIEYFCALLPHKNILLEKHEHFVKQSYRNRCYILAANRTGRLTLPLTGKHGKVRITDVRLDPGAQWQSNLWRTLSSAYAKSPYFEHYADDLKKLIFSKQKFLYDLNYQILSMCLDWLQWSKSIGETSQYQDELPGQFHDLRNVISPKKDYQGRPFYQAFPYQQVFGNSFVHNLSIIDLVFCEGPRAAEVVEGSRRRM